jgi:hypothetical protein
VTDCHRRTEREVVTIHVAPNRHPITLAVEDGLRVSVTYGNTTHTYDASTGQSLGWSTDGTDPPTAPPRIKIGRLGPDQLADINAAAHQTVYGDA